MVTANELRNDIDGITNYAGTPVRFRYYSVTNAGSYYDDDIILTQSGNDVWCSGLHFPISSYDAMLEKQGRLLNGDVKLYVNGSVSTDGFLKVGIGSPVLWEGEIIEQGINTHELDDDVYKKLYLRSNENKRTSSLLSGCVAFYKLDETDKTTITDSSTTQNNVALDSNAIYTVAFYTFDDVATDSSGNGMDLTATDITYDTGKLGNAAVFNGSTSYLQKTSFTNSNFKEQSMSAWIYVTDLSSVRTIMSYNGYSTIDIQTDGRIRVELQGTGGRRVWSVGTVNINEWTHISVCNRGGAANQPRQEYEIDIYINGVLQSKTSIAIGTATTTTTTLNIGCYNSTTNLFIGKIDDFRIYQHVLLQAEVDEIYNSGAGTTSDKTYTYFETGKHGNARRIYGQSDYYAIASTTVPSELAFDYTNSFSFSAWIKPYTLPGVNSVGILGRVFNYCLDMTGDGTQCDFRFGVRVSSTTTQTVTTKYNYNINEWHYLVGVYDASERKVYLHVDGVIDTVGASASTVDFLCSATLTLCDGAISNGNIQGFNGLIDEIGIWNRILQPYEITMLYNSGNGLRYPFKEIP
jgi:hypothetical protein